MSSSFPKTASAAKVAPTGILKKPFELRLDLSAEKLKQLYDSLIDGDDKERTFFELLPRALDADTTEWIEKAIGKELTMVFKFKKVTGAPWEVPEPIVVDPKANATAPSTPTRPSFYLDGHLVEDRASVVWAQ